MGSYYEKEQRRVQELIREPLLELVLELLPHLQRTASARLDVWEVVATRLHTLWYERALLLKEKTDEIPVLSGQFVQEMYDRLMEGFDARFNLSTQGPRGHMHMVEPLLPLREQFSARGDRLLCELFYLRGYDVEVMAKLSRERLEQSQRAAEAGPGAGLVEAEQHRLLQHRFALLERKLEEKERQLQKVMDENKRLLELNHELVQR